MKVSSTQVQNNFGKYLKFVEAHEEVIITKKGRVVAKIVPCEEEKSGYLLEEAAEYQSSSWVTYEAFLELVENSDQRFELIDGVVYNLASPSYGHQYAVGELLAAYHDWFKGKSCSSLTSPFDVTLPKDENNICVVQPDIIVICDKNKIDKKGRYNGVPSLVVEVLSASTRSKDMLKKLELYKHCGVSEYWVVDPNREHVLVYAFKNGEIEDLCTYAKNAAEYIDSIVFEGLRVRLADVFVNL